jgi:uncharacterized protein YndB with AHSA1/START domain
MKKWAIVGLIVIGLLILVGVGIVILLNTGPSMQELRTMAEMGQINEKAPAKVTREVVVKASVERVWEVLSDIDHWDQWATLVITNTRLDGKFGVGDTFTGGRPGAAMVIQSTLALIDPPHRLAFCGDMSAAKVIHVWKLEKVSENETRVTVKESVDGLAGIMGQGLIGSDTGDLAVWVKQLKEKFE